MREPVLFRRDISAEPIVNLGLSSSKQTHAQISRLAEDVLADQLRGIDGVSVVNVDGALRRELSVLLHAQKLREYNVSAGEVVAALRAQNTNAPVGRIKGDLDEKNIRLVGRIETPGEFNDIVVKRQGNEIVRLGQLATVEDGFAEPGTYSLHSGETRVGLSVIRRVKPARSRWLRGYAKKSRKSTRRCPREPSSKSPMTVVRMPKTASTMSCMR